MLQVGAHGPKLASVVLFYPPPTCVSIMLLGWRTTPHPQDIIWCSGRIPAVRLRSRGTVKGRGAGAWGLTSQ